MKEHQMNSAKEQENDIDKNEIGEVMKSAKEQGNKSEMGEVMKSCCVHIQKVLQLIIIQARK